MGRELVLGWKWGGRWKSGFRMKTQSSFPGLQQKQKRVENKGEKSQLWWMNGLFSQIKANSKNSTPGPSHPHHGILSILSPSLKNTPHPFSFSCGLTIKWVILHGPDLLSRLSDANMRETVIS